MPDIHEDKFMKYNLGDRVYAKRTGALAEILNHKKSDNKDQTYYVHYDGYNRRLDEWIKESDICTIKDYEGGKDGIHNEQQNSPHIKMTRQKMRKFNEMYHVHKTLEEMDPTTAALEKEYTAKTNIKYINKVIMGQFMMDTWYYSPFPNEYEKIPIIYVCGLCLKYMANEKTYIDHTSKCNVLPPGLLIYQKDEIKVFEINGEEHKLYCQNLCLVAKLFLDHKTLYFDVSPFLFYVTFEVKKGVHHLTAYFSKEKNSIDNYNVSCILTFPPFQKKGYGKFLISLSYELSKKQNIIGTPERPLSDLGHLSYRSYWTYVIFDHLRTCSASVLNVNELSAATGIAKVDIIETLQTLNLLKFWKDGYVFCFSSKDINDSFKRNRLRAPKLKLDPNFLKI